VTKPKAVAANFNERTVSRGPKVRAWDAALTQQRAALKKRVDEPQQARESKNPRSEANTQETVLAETTAPPTTLPMQPAPEYVTVREEFFMIVRQGTATSAPASWQVHIVEISVMPVQPQQKQVPRKI